ncbi:MAG: flagellar motor switch protein FliN [Rectinemataceae bacterium]|jgi:flagellar motor switch protein FliN/FliY
MSDGALSQEEIDSLLAGLDGGPGSQSAPAAAGRQGAALSPQEAQAFKAILESTLSAQSQNLSMITGLPVTIQSPVVDGATRDDFLRDVPEEVLTVSVPFAGSLPGDHSFVMSKEMAIKIASLANKDETLSDLDDMAVSAVQECVSTLAGTQITVVSEKTGNRNITAGVAEGAFGPKAMSIVPSGDFLRAVYPVQIGDGPSDRLVELFALSFVRDVLASAGGGMQSSQPQSSAMMGQQMGGQQMGSQQMGGQQMGGQQMGGQQMGGQQMGGQQMGGQQMAGGGGQMGNPYGGMQGYGGGYGGMNPPNVQPVQFASLQMQQASPESGNIGLIMDVNMEMTVELGRTRKLIKEILGMGEGTIIELDKLAGEPVDILVNHKLIAKGEVVVIDENFGVRVTEIVSPMERMGDLG